MSTKRTIEWKWGTSRAVDTYGYTICRCLVDGEKKGTTCGGGYDLKGTAYAEAMMKTFPAELLALADRAHSKYRVTGEKKDRKYERLETTGTDLLYGMTAYYDADDKPIRVSLDGACGLESIDAIILAAGYRREFVKKDVSILLPVAG